MPPLNNKATYTEWYERVRDFTSKKDVVDGKVKVTKQGWSKKTFDRKLELVKKKYGNQLVKTGDGQGATYALLPVKDAKAKEGVQPESRGSSTVNQFTVSPEAASRQSLMGIDAGDAASQEPPSSVNQRHDGSDAGSRESGTEANPIAETDLEKAARDHLNATKH
jgi:hypothetical protein